MKIQDANTEGLAEALVLAFDRHLSGSCNPGTAPRAVDQDALFLEVAKFVGLLTYRLPTSLAMFRGEPVDPVYVAQVANELAETCKMATEEGAARAIFGFAPTM